jgi:hypothetical protein
MPTAKRVGFTGCWSGDAVGTSGKAMAQPDAKTGSGARECDDTDPPGAPGGRHRVGAGGHAGPRGGSVSGGDRRREGRHGLRRRRPHRPGRGRGGTPVRVVPGGAACNTIVGVAGLGGAARFVGKAGNGRMGALFADHLRNSGVEPVLSRSDSPTGRVLSVATPDAQRAMLTSLGASAEMVPGGGRRGRFRGGGGGACGRAFPVQSRSGPGGPFRGRAAGALGALCGCEVCRVMGAAIPADGCARVRSAAGLDRIGPGRAVCPAAFGGRGRKKPARRKPRDETEIAAEISRMAG